MANKLVGGGKRSEFKIKLKQITTTFVDKI